MHDSSQSNSLGCFSHSYSKRVLQIYDVTGFPGRSKCWPRSVLKIDRHRLRQPPDNSLFSASKKDITQASPSIADCFPCKERHSLERRSNPSVFTSATRL